MPSMPDSDFTVLDEFNFYPTLADSRGASLVLFTTPECGACRVYRRALRETQTPGAGFRVFVVDAGNSLALTREYEVFHLPALFLFRDGHFHARLDAAPVPRELRRAVADRLGRPAEEAP